MSVVQEFKVTGMTCGHCEMSVKEEIGALEGVIEVTADHATGEVKVTAEHALDRALVKAAVADAGYSVQE